MASAETRIANLAKVLQPLRSEGRGYLQRRKIEGVSQHVIQDAARGILKTREEGSVTRGQRVHLLEGPESYLLFAARTYFALPSWHLSILPLQHSWKTWVPT